MKVPKTLWPEIVQVVCNLKNCSSNVDSITPYECLKETKPNLSHICVFSAHAWVHIPKEKRKKLDKRSWQGIYVSYEGTNQYRICNPCTRKVHVTYDVTIDKRNLFDKKAFQPKELVDNE